MNPYYLGAGEILDSGWTYFSAEYVLFGDIGLRIDEFWQPLTKADEVGNPSVRPLIQA
jgi:hypothetical protein